MLKDQLHRALMELKSYQLQYPSQFAAQAAAVSEEDEDGLKLTASPVITSALFVAYDTRKFCFNVVEYTQLMFKPLSRHPGARGYIEAASRPQRVNQRKRTAI
jgi:hypothetical protein